MKFDLFKTITDKLGSILTNPLFPAVGPDEILAMLRGIFPSLPGIIHGQAAGTGANIVIGRVAGGGVTVVNAALTFDPKLVLVWNQTDPGLFLHVAGMTAAHMAKLTDAPALTHAAANGITIDTTAGTITLGTDVDMNGAADALHYFAIGV